MANLDEIRNIFSSFIIRDLRPFEDRDGIRIGEDVRIHREKDTFVLRFLKNTPEKRKNPIRQRLEEHNIKFKEGDPFTL